MTDPNETTDQQARASKTEAPPLAVKSDRAGNDQGPDAGIQPAESKGRRAFSFIRELNTNERVTALLAAATTTVAIGGLFVSYLTYLNAADTKDIKGAVSKLAILAEQTKRQADAQNGQLSVMRDQVGALKEQLLEAKAQTKAISKQTGAIDRSTGATILAAKAQANASDIAATAQQPRISLQDVSLEGFKGAPDPKTGLVKLTMNYHFVNGGGGILVLKMTRMGIVFPKNTTDKIQPFVSVSGNELIVGQYGTFFNQKPIEFFVTKEVSDAVTEGRQGVLFYGSNQFVDAKNSPHLMCFNYALPIKEGRNDGFVWVETTITDCKNI